MGSIRIFVKNQKKLEISCKVLAILTTSRHIEDFMESCRIIIENAYGKLVVQLGTKVLVQLGKKWVEGEVSNFRLHDTTALMPSSQIWVEVKGEGTCMRYLHQIKPMPSEQLDLLTHEDLNTL